MNDGLNKKIIPIPLTEPEALAEYFSDMASKGWVLTSMPNKNMALFIQDKPQKLIYNVDFFRLDAYHNEREYLSLREASGWIKVCNLYQENMYIFVSNKECPVPLQTDPLIQAEQLKQAARRQLIGIVKLSTMLIIVFVFRILFIIDREDILYRFQYTYSTGSFLIVLSLFTCFIYDFAQFIKCKKKIKNLYRGIPIKPMRYTHFFRVRRYLITALALNMVVYILCAIPRINPVNGNSPADIISINDLFDDKKNREWKSVDHYYLGATNPFISEDYSLYSFSDEGNISLQFVRCHFDWVSKTIINHLYEPEISTGWQSFSLDECKQMGISCGSYAQDLYTRYYKWQIGNKYYEMRLYGCETPNSTIIHAIEKMNKA